MDINSFDRQEEEFLKLSKEIDMIVFRKSVDSEKIQMNKLFNDMHVLLDEMHKLSTSESERIITRKYKDLLIKYNEIFKFMVNDDENEKKCNFCDMIKKIFKAIIGCCCNSKDD